jgi:hypothetical protein
MFSPCQSRRLVAGRLAGREQKLTAALVECVGQAVDPTEREGLVDDLVTRHVRVAAVPLVGDQPDAR